LLTAVRSLSDANKSFACRRRFYSAAVVAVTVVQKVSDGYRGEPAGELSVVLSAAGHHRVDGKHQQPSPDSTTSGRTFFRKDPAHVRNAHCVRS
jgi:hypothetical protein